MQIIRNSSADEALLFSYCDADDSRANLRNLRLHYYFWGLGFFSLAACFALLIYYHPRHYFGANNENSSDVFVTHNIEWHTRRDLAVCIDKLSSSSTSSAEKISSNPFNGKKSAVHLVFIGDSRIRQHFLNFFKFIPNYDFEYQPKYNSYYKVSEDMNITSRVLNLNISFYFRRWLGNDTTQVFSKWTESPPTDGEIRVILVGISLHHMLDANGTENFQEFKERLTQLEPIISRVMAKGNKVVWLNQYPAIDSFGPLNTYNDVYSEKIHHYNLATKRILRNSGVIIWESGNDLVEEYLRSCVLLQRADIVYFGNAYFNCLDYVHPGYSALSQAIQFFLNEICNDNYKLV